jgi:hypothetical protein
MGEPKNEPPGVGFAGEIPTPAPVEHARRRPIPKVSEPPPQPAGEHIMQFFAYDHLPPHLQEVSKLFAQLADQIMGLPRNPERTVALRKLLESKDAAVRARLAK